MTTFDAILITANGPRRIVEVLEYDHLKLQALVVTEDVGFHWVNLDSLKLVAA
jgi:hypothetical protein